jgi:hypothetical protein
LGEQKAMTFPLKRSSGAKANPKKIFLFFLSVFFLTSLIPGGFANGKSRKQKVRETYIQQISAGEEPPLDIGNVYKIVPPNKLLQISTQFKVVDDFNVGELKNRLGGTWFVEKGEEKKIQLSLKKEDARGYRSGASLLARFNLRKNEQASFRTSLEKLDMSAAHYLVLKCKVQPPGLFTGHIRVALRDWAGKTVQRDITDACLEKGDWNNVIVPMPAFMGVDLNQLTFLSFNILAQKQNMAGRLGLDEIAFFGHPEVGFESVEDNLVGFPHSIMDEPRRQELLAIKNDKELLLQIAKDTWRYFENAADKKNHLVVDHLKIGDFPLAAAYTSPTNIALDLMGTVSARELGIITPDQAAQRVQRVLNTLKKMKVWKGFFFNFYETTQLGVTRQFVSSIDNGWLAISLVVVRQAFPGEIAREATAILNSFNFEEFLDPDSNQLAIGYDLERQGLTPYHYGMLVTEARAMSLYAIGKGDLAQTHWWSLQRTGPESWDWQTQKPQGKMVERDGVRYFQGYYKEGGKKFVPSWGGSAFEFFMPTMVIDEKKFAPKGLGLNDRVVAELQRDYALKEKKYPVWGISPASTADGRRWQYGEYGIKKTGIKGYPDRGVITPHASFLALESLPEDVLKNTRKLLTFPIYGEYGFYDSVTFPSERVNTQYLALDQGMTLIPIANYLKKGVIQEYFHKDPVGKNIKKLLGQEDFFKS